MGYDTTSASVHDSQRGAELVDDSDAVGDTFWLDAWSAGAEEGFVGKSVLLLGFRGHTLNEDQKKAIPTSQRFVVA
jgi:hypothetical protein